MAAAAASFTVDQKKEGLREAKEKLKEIILDSHCNPIIVRLAWHDSGSYDKNVKDFPLRGGTTGSIRFYPEMGHGANAGLSDALELIKGIADEEKGVGYADVFQLASGTAIELAGGPKIPLRFGRKDAATKEDCVPEGRLPAGGADKDAPEGEQWPEKAKNAGDHLRKVFYRMGLNDQEIVALSGAHTLGRANPKRSGFGKESTKYTKDGPGTPGGSSWTPEWLKFDNSYFIEIFKQSDPELLVLETDDVLIRDDGFRPYAEKYAKDQDLFFKDYVQAHLKLSELGAEWIGEPFTLD